MSAPELKTLYTEKVRPEIMSLRGHKNALQVPRLEKIVINSGVGAVSEKNRVNEVADDIGRIAGQKPIITKARLSISNFKLREGMPIGVKVTLRGNQMWEFFLRILAVALPNIRDFQGINKRLDGQGNYTLGISDHTIFPEIRMEGVKHTTGMDISFVTNAKNDDEGGELLTLLGMPFRK
ncbi:MAG: 50S ribosomal protein L5 [Opitutae bacterium]|jgi:large subunit ribosomal protein L5|nr:50S ribosomal protein L5 [Opitutae bacterium]MBT4224307.1 50S ribosomal protein L5 [Opitutae bacterium]MBT5377828.1 50S ribosomal protein L5 [Opitutae bacterium]MBT5692208.1 50S ribosomal protein L5 [Opitutae bacterium]MBT6463665.1 50S ribosomal protein L5 [Opitutae bacterium]